jgi:hypothetical protein
MTVLDGTSMMQIISAQWCNEAWWVQSRDNSSIFHHKIGKKQAFIAYKNKPQQRLPHVSNNELLHYSAWCRGDAWMDAVWTRTCCWDCCIPLPMVVGDDIQLTAEHAAGLDATETHTISCLPDHCNRIMEIIGFIHVNYSNLVDFLIVELSPEQKANSRLYHKAAHDILYNCLKPKLVKVFMNGYKKKNPATRKHYSKEHVRKYHNAILKCSDLAQLPLQPDCVREMKTHLLLIMKELAQAKGDGETEDQEADPISFEFYKELCLWSIESNWINDMAFNTLQWNLMGRLANANSLGFHNPSWSHGSDSIINKYNANKKDKAGDYVTPKNCYANPKDDIVCVFLVIGCYLALNQEKFKQVSDKIFCLNCKKGSVSDRCCKSLKATVMTSEKRKMMARLFVWFTILHPHGNRKGAASHVTTNTMEPPPMQSILL